MVSAAGSDSPLAAPSPGATSPDVAPQEGGVSPSGSLLPAFVLQGIEAPFRTALAGAGFAVAPFDAERLQSCLAPPAQSTGRSTRPLAVIWAAPAAECAAALLHGADPGGFLAQWRSEVEQLLTMFKRHRRALVLIESASLSDPEAHEQHEAIRKRLALPGLALPLEPAAAEAAQAGAGGAAADSPDAEPFLTHLARLLLHHDPIFPDLLAELDAASISTRAGERPGIVPADNVMAAMASWRAGLRRAADFEAQVDVQQSRVETLATMLDAQRQEAGALKTERELLQRQVELQLEAMKAQSPEREGQPLQDHPQVRQLARELAAARQENALLSKQLAAAKEAEAAAHAANAALPWTSADLIEQVSLGPGATRSDGIIRLSTQCARVHALFGPYFRLPAGTYEACISLRLKPRGLERPVAVLELAWNVDDILGLRRIEGARLQDQSFVLREAFAISPEQAKTEGQGLEVRLWTDQISAGEVSVLCIRKL